MAIGPTKFTIPGLWAGLQDKIFAESSKSFEYQQQTKGFVEQTDIDQAIADLKKALVAKAKRKLGESYEGYNQVLYQIDETSVSAEVDADAGEEKEEFSAQIETDVIIVAFDSESTIDLAKNKLQLSVPDDKELVSFDKDTVSYELKDVNTGQGTASVNMSFNGVVKAKKGMDIVDRNKIVGLKEQQIRDYLSQDEDIAGYDLRFYPAFIDKAPDLVDRIEVKIKD
jgi:hypothetical protein